VSKAISSQEYAIILLKGMIKQITPKNIIAWAKSESNTERITLLKKDETLDLGNGFYISYDGRNLKKLKEI